MNPSKVKHWLALVLVVSLSALGTRLVLHPQTRSNYTHGSVSVEGIFPYMPDEEGEKNFGHPVQESQGQVNLYSRDGHRAQVDLDSVSWCATGVSGSRLEVNGLAVLRVGDLQSKAERVLRRLSQDGKVAPAQPVWANTQILARWPNSLFNGFSALFHAPIRKQTRQKSGTAL